MTKILIHEIPAASHDLVIRLRAVLGEIGGDEAERLAGRLDQLDRRKPRLVLTGQFSSGKSTLINALTDNPSMAETGADVTTDRVTEYEWGREVLVVDTPGVQSGLREHDELAEDAIAGSDLVLFVMTPDLLDDAGEAHLRDVAIKFAKFDQMLVVVTMKNTMSADPLVRQDAVDRALGDGRRLTVVECDAGDYLLGGQFVAISGVDELRSAINVLTEASGQLAVDRQPLQLVASTAAEAAALVIPDPQVSALLRLLALRRKALTNRSARIEIGLSDLRQQFVARAGKAADEFADKLDELDEADLSGSHRDTEFDVGQARLEAALAELDEWFGTATEAALDAQFEDLQSEVAEIERSPQAKEVGEFTRPVVELGEPRRMRLPDLIRPKSRNLPLGGKLPNFVEKIPDWSAKFVNHWGAGQGKALSDSSGTPGHLAVKGLAGKLGIKLGPWQAVKTADKVGRVAKHAAKVGTIIAIVDSGREVFDEIAQLQAERKRQARRRTTVNGIASEAQKIANDLHSYVRAQIQAEFRPFILAIDELRQQVLDAQGNRAAASLDLERIASEARRILEDSSPHLMVEGRT
ncbi:GTPase [Arthrobacter sp. TE12232]